MSFSLDVSGDVMDDSNRGAYVAIESRTVVFNCSFSVDPQPSVEWLHNHQLIQTQQISKYRTATNTFTDTPPIGHTYYQLTLLSAAEEDTGNYTCRGINEYGDGEVMQRLIVIGQFMQYI